MGASGALGFSRDVGYPERVPHTRCLLRAFLIALVLGQGACAAGGARSIDSGAADVGPQEDATVDAVSAPDVFDGGTDATGGTDSGPGERMTCEACTEHEDCAVDFFCLDVGGGMACLPKCNRDIPDCPPRFDCVDVVGPALDSPVCVPVGERCCVDADGDLHGEGLGCLGTDCDEDDAETNSSASEVCDNADNDCNEIVDDGDPAVICPTGAQVAVSACAMGNCAVAECVPGWGDCDESAETGCEAPLSTPENCGGCAVGCAPNNAVAECPGGSCGIDVCLDGFGDCNGDADDGCETQLNSPTNCGTCRRGCSVLNAIPGCDGTDCTVAMCNPGFANCDGSPLNGCETSTTTNANCGGCGAVCSPAHGVGECSTGSCRIASCGNGWEDCDGDPSNGCETNMRTLTNCGGCGIPCSLAGGTASCATGICMLSGCGPLQGDCDGISGNGCETSLSTRTNCNGCGIACTIGNGTGSCPGGTCTVDTCNSGFADCDMNAANGCESPLNTLTNCGGCGVTCDRANASETCGSGSCQTGTCSSGFGNCDGFDSNGCERSLNSNVHCGGCGVTCALPGASESCASGSCTFTGCEAGFSTCDGSTSNGCELRHAAVESFCGDTMSSVGAYDGDTSCGFICGGNGGWDLFATRQGRTSRWFHGLLREGSSCPTSVEHRFTLDVPPGVNYDLYVYRNNGCGMAPVATSASAGLGTDEQATYRIGDPDDDLTPYFVEVR